MSEFGPIEGFGRRIMIAGPSGSGKSTLTLALARRLGLDPVSLDVLRHAPYTNWVPVPAQEFAAAHAKAISKEAWVIEGNYASYYPDRLARATGIIQLGNEPWHNAFRYVRRTLFEGPDRPGQLEGGTDKLKWSLFRYVLVDQPRKHDRDQQIFISSRLPLIALKDRKGLNRLYAEWDLRRR